MANWYGTARSNYVRVKDSATFYAWAQTLPDVEVVEKNGTFALIVDSNSDSGGWPSLRPGVADEDQEIDIASEIVPHLAAGEVFVYCECGAEKLRYLTGWSMAVNDKGETLHISIDDIYSLVKKRWNCTPTVAMY